MSIEKRSATEIKSSGLHYLALPSEVIDAIADQCDLETLGLWTLLCNRPKNFQVRKDQIMAKYNISRRSFTACMKNLERLQLSCLEVLDRHTDGTLGGKSWHVSNLPFPVIEAIKETTAVLSAALNGGLTDPTKSGQSVVEAVDNSVSPTLPKVPTSVLTDPSVSGRDITKDLSLTKYLSLKDTNHGNSTGHNLTRKYLPTDWRPNDTSLGWMHNNLLPAGFIESCIAEFKLFWNEANGKKTEHQWDTAFNDSVAFQMRQAGFYPQADANVPVSEI